RAPAAAVGRRSAPPPHLHQRGGEEAAEADVEDEAALDDLDDGAAHDAVVLLDLLDRAPRALVPRTLLREDQATFLVLLGEDEGFDVVTDRHHFRGVHVVLDRQLARGDDALGLVADVEQDLVPIDLDAGAFDNVAVVEVLDGLVDGCEECFLRAKIVDGDLVGARGGLDAARHVDCCSERMVSWCLSRPAELPAGTARTSVVIMTMERLTIASVIELGPTTTDPAPCRGTRSASASTSLPCALPQVASPPGDRCGLFS